MSVIIPKRRDNPVGRPNITQPTRGNIKRQPVSSDPGARGGPTNIPTNAFTGASQGTLDLGSGIQQVAATESAQLQRELNRSDYINTEIEKGNLANDLNKITAPFDPVSGSYTNIDGTVTRDGMVRVQQLIEEKTTERIEATNNNQSYSRLFAQEFPLQAELVKQNVYAKLRNRVNTERSSQFKLALQAELVQVVGDTSSAQDVVMLVRANKLKSLESRYLSSLTTAERNEVLSDANAGLLKDAARKFVLGGQFVQAKERIYQIIGALELANISSTGWTGKSVRDAFQYIDDEQIKYNNTQQSGKQSDKQISISEVDKLNIPDKEKTDLKIQILTGKAPAVIPDFQQKLNLIDSTFEKIITPTAAQVTDYVNQRRKILSGLDPYTKAEKSEFEKKLAEIEKQFAVPEGGERTPEDETRYHEAILSLTAGLKPETVEKRSDIEIKQDKLDELYENYKNDPTTGIDRETYIEATLQLNSGYKKPAPAAATVAQDRAKKYLNEQLELYNRDNKTGISPAIHKKMMAKVMTGEDLPELGEDLKPNIYNLISNLTDARLGAKAIAAGTLQPKAGYEEFSARFKEEVVQTYLTGIYPNGSEATGERNIFEIINRIAKIHKSEMPKMPTPEKDFDNRVGIEIKGTSMTIVNPAWMGKDIPTGSALDIANQNKNLISSEYLGQRIKNAARKAGLGIEEATGLWSGLKNAVAKFSQILGNRSEDPRVTQSRLLYSLIARDFIRFVSLSPRFAVKEQELLRDLFPSSGALNSPRQTRSRLMLFRNLLKKKIGDLRSTAIHVKDLKEESIEAAKIWTNTIRNINTLMPEIPRVESLSDLKNLSPRDAYDYLHSEILGDSARKVSRDDFTGYRKVVFDKYGPKKGEARIRILEKKMGEYQRLIKSEKR